MTGFGSVPDRSLSVAHGPPLEEEPGIGALTLPGFFLEVTRRHGPSEAIAQPRPGGAVERWSYDDFRERSMEVARALTACGLGRGARVGILMTNRAEFLSALFGTALAGGTAAPLSTFSTPAELDFLISNAACSVLLIEPDVLKRDSVVGPIPPLPFEPAGSDIREQLDAHRHELPWSGHLACFDGKKHADHRYLLNGLLTYRRLKENEDFLVGLADQLIDGFIERGECDVVPEYAHATTVHAISDLMGIPVEDRPELLGLIGAPPSQVDGDTGDKTGADPLRSLEERFERYLRERLEAPRQDLMSELVHSRFKDGSKPEFEALSNLARFLFGAGQDTASRLIAIAVRILRTPHRSGPAAGSAGTPRRAAADPGDPRPGVPLHHADGNPGPGSAARGG